MSETFEEWFNANCPDVMVASNQRTREIAKSVWNHQEATIKESYQEALSIANALHRDYFSVVAQWKPLPDTVGLLTQIDNMCAGIRMKRDEQAAEIAVLKNNQEQMIFAAQHNDRNHERLTKEMSDVCEVSLAQKVESIKLREEMERLKAKLIDYGCLPENITSPEGKT